MRNEHGRYQYNSITSMKHGRVTEDNVIISFAMIPGTHLSTDSSHLDQILLCTNVPILNNLLPGIVIKSDRDVTIHGINKNAFSVDGFLALPVDLLGNEYYTAR